MPGLKHIIQQHPLTVGITTAIISVVALGSVWFFVAQNQQEDITNAAASERYAVQSVDLPVKSLSPSELSSVQSLSINGQLNVNNSLILSPSSRPSSPVKGQLYYDGTSNTIAYYDGTVFTSVADSVGQSAQDTRINQVEQEVVTLRNTASVVPADIALLGSNNTFSGTNLFDGSISTNGLYVNAAAQVAKNLLVGGSTTVSQSLTVNGAATLGATSISSLVLSTTLPVTSGGTGVGSFSANGVVIGNGTNPLGSVSAGAADLCFMSTSGAPEFKPCPGGVGSGVNSLNGLYGSLSIANATAAGSTITINNASTNAKGLAQFNATNFSVTGGVVNTAQNIATTATPTFSALQVTNNATIGGALTIGIACTPGQILTTNGSGTVVCVTDDTGTDTNTTYAAGSGITITGAANTISVNPQTGGGLSFTGGQLGLIGCSAGQILKYTGTAWGCAADADTISPGDGVGVTAVGTLNSQTKNSNGATIYDNGGTLTVALQSADATNPGLITTGAQTFSGAKVFSDDISLQGSIGQSGAGTFTTGTGAVALNGDVTIASGKSLTLGVSCAANQVLTTNSSGVITCAADNTGTDTNTTYTAGDGISISGASNTIAVSPQTGGGLSFSSGQLGLIACTAGQILKYTGTAWGCATDSDTVSPGDGIGVTAVGTLDGQTKNSNGAAIYNNGGTLTIALQTADDTVAGLVSTGLQTFSGAKTFTSPLTVQNNFVQSGAATFTSGTGAVALNGDVTIASGKGLTLGTSCSSGQVLTTNGSGVVTCVTDNTGTDTNTTYAAGDGIAITGASNTISVNPQTGGGLEFAGGQLGLLACTAGQILKYDGTDWACAVDSDTISSGDGIGVTAVGALDGQTKNSNGATIYNNGGTLTIALQSADNLNSGLLTAGAQTIGGAKTFVNDIALQGNFGQSGSSTFSTGTGAVALNGDVTIASGKSLTIGTACTAGQVLTTDTNGVITCATDNTGTDTDTTYAAGNGIAITGPSNTISVNPQTGGGLSFVGGQLGITACSDGEILKYSSGAWGCAVDSDTVSPGDGVGVTAVGTLDSQTKNSNGATIYNNGGTLTIALQSADDVTPGVITTSTQTFSGAKTFKDALTMQGAITQTGAGTFSTGTGAVALNGNVTIASGKSLTIGTACTAGQVLTTDSNGIITCATDNTGTDTNTTYTAGDGIAITGASNAISVRLQTGGGLSIVGGQLGLLGSCTDGQVLKSESGTWVCADDVDTNTGVAIASGSGTSGRVAKFNASGELEDSNLLESGTTITYSGNFVVNGQAGFTGNLLDVQLNGTSRLSVAESGATTINGGLTVAAASGVTVGVAGSVAGSIQLATTGAGSLTILSQPQTGNVTLSAPAITGNDTICLQTLGNCAGSAGVATSGAVTTGALTKFDASGDITSSGLNESGTTLNYSGNLVANVDTGFSGNILDLQKAGTSLFKVSSGGLVTTAGGISGVSATADNTAGGDLVVKAGNGTGSGGSGAITFSTAAAGGSSAVYKDLSGMLYFPNAGPPMTHSYTVSSGTNQALLVAINSSKDITSVTYAGQDLTLLYQYTPESHISYWYLLNPPAGTANIVSQFTDGFASATTRAMVLENVNQTTPFGTPCTNGGYVPTTSCTLSTDATDVVYAIVSSRLAGPEAGSGQTSIFEDTNGGGAYASMSYKPASGASTTVSYTTSSGTQQGILAVAAKSADVPEANGANQMEERLRITNEGNIGIGTINPQYLLDVNGDINTSAGILTGGVTRIDASGQADFSALNVSGATTLGVLGSSAGQLSLASAGAGTVTITTASQTGDYTITIPALSANDTVCFQTLANCGSGDAMTVGTIDGQTKSADGAVISGSSIYLQTADATHPGLVSTSTQTIAGVKTFNDTINLAKSLNVAAGVNVSGYATSETSNTYTGQYTKIANCTITDAYKVCRSQAVAVGTRDGATNPGRATIDFRVQQNALGSEPLVNVEITDTNGNVDASDFAAVSNVTGSQSSVDLYFKIDDNYRQYAISPLVNVQYGSTWNYQATTWLSTQGFVASVPSGTQTTGVDARVVAATLISKGTTTLQGNLTGTTASFTGKVSLGTASATAGQLGLASTGAGSVTLTTAAQTANRTITIPAVTGDDTVCLQNLGNCAGGSGGVGTSGTVTTGALTKFDGSGGITSSGLTESGTSLNYGGNVVANVGSGFSGHILDLQKAGSSVFKVGSSGLVTTAGGISGVAATGTNATGGNLTLQAGSGTGSAGSGVISFSTASQAQSPFIKDLTPAGQFYQSTSAAVSASFSQTVTSGSNQVLLVTMATGHGGVSATSVTYGGVALTKLAGVRQTYDASYTEMWYLVNPNVGSATVSVTLSTSATLYARAMVLTGVNQTTPFNTACTATASTTSITCSADTSGAGVVVSLLRASATYSSIGSGQVSVYGNDTPPAYTSVSAKATTTSSTSMSYTLSSGTYWGFVAVGVRLADTGVNPMGLTLVDTGTLEGGPLTERMRIASDGKVGIGTFNPQYQLDVAGDINTSTGFRVGGTAGVSLSCSGATQTLGNVTVTGGIITAASCATNSSDLAENYASTDNLTAGEIVMTSGVATSVNRATSAHRGDVIGVVSTAPGILIGTEQVPDGHPIALSGRVPVKVTNENGPIAVGDKITISSVAGVGMKATTSGMIVGTALEAFNGEEGTVEVFVNASYWAPSASETLQGATAEFTSLNVSGEATIATLSVGTVTVTGNITVHGLLTVASIVVNGHVITASGKPTVEAQTALNGGNVTVEGTDTVGTITITTGSTPTAGELAKIIFSQTYSKAPRVIVSPSNEAAADFAYYKGAVSLDDFMLNAKFAPAANTTYVFDYFIAE